jgi:hypothetical protein
MEFLQIGEYINKGKYSFDFNLKTTTPNVCLVKKPIVGKMDSYFLHHSKGHLMFFTSI